MVVRRLSTGIREFDGIIEGGIPQGFFVAVTGEPGTGKTIFCLHFIEEGLKRGDLGIYVTTEESMGSIVNQASQFGMKFKDGLEKGRVIIVDAFMGSGEWSLRDLTVNNLVDTIIEAKRKMGYGNARIVIDSLSAFWLDKPAMARRYSYYVKRVLSKWGFTVVATSQYAITTADAFGWGVEHIADGIIRFRRIVRGGKLRRYIIVEKMRQTSHSLIMYEIGIVDGRGLVILGPAWQRREDYALPKEVRDRIMNSRSRVEGEIP